jgi:hypothetical protein
MPKPTGPQFSAYEQELLNAVERRAKNPAPLGHGSPGVLGPLDEDQINRTQSGIRNLSDFGYTLKHTGRREFAVDTGDPDVLISGGAHPETGGFQVDLLHYGRYESNEDGSYKYPENWGTVGAHLNVSEHELPTALMDWITSPEVQHHMRRPS